MQILEFISHGQRLDYSVLKKHRLSDFILFTDALMLDAYISDVNVYIILYILTPISFLK